MVKGTSQEKTNLFTIAIDFLENRHPRLKFDKSSISIARGKDYIGDLGKIQKDFMTNGWIFSLIISHILFIQKSLTKFLKPNHAWRIQ